MGEVELLQEIKGVLEMAYIKLGEVWEVLVYISKFVEIIVYLIFVGIAAFAAYKIFKWIIRLVKQYCRVWL